MLTFVTIIGMSSVLIWFASTSFFNLYLDDSPKLTLPVTFSEFRIAPVADSML